ncbi:hypothetical protein [Limnoglobus roseus]|uniref:Conjugal transfer protein n=1 Tax=Limnoglobus roseus TaxID=2598579 RepID=A0A5C1ANW6_9BACT|nr:hypothetical protein [Limnoglobus roseus]QEL18914.1 hypothetical protein PX52LOC_05964 [Limnoglobus roseus]
MNIRQPFVAAAGLLALSLPVSAQKPTPAKAPSAEARPSLNPLALIQNPLADLGPTVQNLLAAAEKFQQITEAVKELAPVVKDVSKQIGGDAVKVSENVASIGKDVDPFGLRMALATIREQNQTILAMQRAESARQERIIQELQAENKKLKEELAAKGVGKGTGVKGRAGVKASR